ncbi:hypothetical protein Hypma_000303 [Hypsizygus marmoreus]|uniref:F-box domain-containing protein n=1 Tax=Hypsizygus marmoreus TaxID=39966 RepID=A0A369J9L3_HYPMA|nr:hypothetical protein Hypma_000303 [Hypsizygus marmoreus]
MSSESSVGSLGSDDSSFETESDLESDYKPEVAILQQHLETCADIPRVAYDGFDAHVRKAQADLEERLHKAQALFEEEMRTASATLKRKLKLYRDQIFGDQILLNDHQHYALPCKMADSSELALPKWSNSIISDIPNEVLRAILWLALPPNFLLDSSLERGPDSSWSRILRFKKSLVLVCRSWHAVGTEFLYSDVVFRRVGQIPAFLRTIHASPVFFAHRVRSMTFSALVPKKFAASFLTQSQRIFELCPQLDHITFDSKFTLPPAAIFSTVPGRVTRLDFGNQVDYSMALQILIHVSQTLSCLSISLSPFIEDQISTPIYFAQVQTLHFAFEQRPWDRPDHVTFMAPENLWSTLTAWSLPKLKHLSCKAIRTGLPTRQIASFCRKHGQQLKFFQIRHRDTWSKESLPVQIILNACPALKHVALDAWESIGLPAHEFSHPNVEWIDLTSRSVWDVDHRGWITAFKSAFVQLRGVRLISDDLLDLDLPLKFPPNGTVSVDDIAIYRMPGLNLRHDVGLLYTAPVPGPRRGYEIGTATSSWLSFIRDEVDVDNAKVNAHQTGGSAQLNNERENDDTDATSDAFSDVSSALSSDGDAELQAFGLD